MISTVSKNLILDGRYLILDGRYLILDGKYLILNGRYLILDGRCLILDGRYLSLISDRKLEAGMMQKIIDILGPQSFHCVLLFFAPCMPK